MGDSIKEVLDYYRSQCDLLRERAQESSGVESIVQRSEAYVWERAAEVLQEVYVKSLERTSMQAEAGIPPNMPDHDIDTADP